VRNASLHALLEAFTLDAAARLSAATADGDQIPFEVVETEPAPRSGRPALYCYRPLTGSFIRQRLGLLVALPTYAPAARALELAEGIEAYLRARGETRISEHPRDRADAALRCLLDRVFEERSEFAFDDARFAVAYEELECALYQGRCVVEVTAPMLGLELDPQTRELTLADGLSIVRGEGITDPPPADDRLLIVHRAAQDRRDGAPLGQARTSFRRVLSALRLFERGAYALGPIGWTRIDAGPWRPVALGGSGRARMPTRLRAEQEDELRAFCNLVARRIPAGSGEVAWALARFEMGCERVSPFEALTDYLLALRALLEPEGPSSGRLAQRQAVICAPPEERRAFAERTAHAISLERAVIAGLAPADRHDTNPDRLVEEVGEHLRAILRDVLCGHLHVDVRGVADELLAEAAAAPV
jgi:hypothetical protein